MSTDKLEEITEEDMAKVSENKEEVQKPRKTKQYVYMIVYEPKAEDKFKIVPIEFKHLSYKHPLIKKTGAIFADEEYAKQFYNFIVKNAKKQDEERKQVALEQMKQQMENDEKKTTLEKLSD